MARCSSSPIVSTPARGTIPISYVGLNDEAADVRQRVKLMTEAVNAAAARVEVDRRTDILKVFMAPEGLVTFAGFTCQ
ncbi:MAG: hypothetical protein ACLP4V_14495 [Methylocella sp.]